MDMGNYDEAFILLKKSLEVCEELENNSEKSTLLSNIATIFTLKGKFIEAVESCEKALTISKEIGDVHQKATVLGIFGGIYQNWGKIKKAGQYYLKSVENFFKTGDLENAHKGLHNLCVMYRDIGAFEMAEQVNKKILDYCEKAKDKRGIASALNVFGSIYYDQEKYDIALDFYNQSLKIFKELGSKRNLLTVLNNIGTVHRENHQYAMAIDYFEQSILFTEEFGDIRLKLDPIYNKGRTFLMQSKYDDAINSYEKCIDIIEILVGNIQSEDIRISFRASLMKPYEEIIETYLKFYKKEQKPEYLYNAIKYLELIKGREIVDKLNPLKSQDYNLQDCPEYQNLLTKEKKMVSKIRRIFNLLPLSDENCKKYLYLILDKLGKKLREYRSNMMEKCKDIGLVYPTKDFNPIPDYENIFKEGKIIIWELIYFDDPKEYDDKFKIIAWEEDRIRLFESNAFKIDELKELLKVFYDIPEIAYEDSKKIQNILDELIPEDLMHTLDGKDKLILIPHYILHYFPWEICTKISLRIPIVRSFALGFLRSCMKRELSSKLKKVLLISNPNYNIIDLNLDGAEKEINALKKIFAEKGISYDSLGRENASKANFSKLIGNQVEIIHFAGNAKFYPFEQDPWLSGLYFYDSESYEILSITEILSKRFMGTPLMILSACETARGEIVKGDEFIGLIRGLALAGASSIVATNWLLSDDVAEFYVIEFYKNLIEGKDVCESLFEARKKIYSYKYDKFKDPYFWGVFTLYGNPFKKLEI